MRIREKSAAFAGKPHKKISKGKILERVRVTNPLIIYSNTWRKQVGYRKSEHEMIQIGKGGSLW